MQERSRLQINEQKIDNPTVNEVRAGSGRQEKILHVDRDHVRAHTKESARFVVFLTSGDLALLWAKHVTTARSEIILQRFAVKDCGILAGKRYTQSLNRRAVTTKPNFFFSLESSVECPSQDDWHVSRKIADTSVN